MAYDKTNRGVLFKNNDKESPKHADYKGNVNVNGEEFWLDAWVNESKAGMKYMSLLLKPKKKTEAAEAEKKAGVTLPDADMDDEIPF
jgi:hypothetical protein